ncbi:MAG: hypothetical protein IBV52_08645 [Candidatus Bathyarchaeota archaeon]
MNKKRRLSPRSQAFHEVERQLEQSKMIARDPVESEIIAEEIESAKIERNRLLKEGTLGKQKTESKTQAEPPNHDFLSSLLELGEVDPARAKAVFDGLNVESKYNFLLPFAKTPEDRQALLLLLTHEKKETGVQDIIDVVKHIQSLTPVQETEIEKIIAAFEIVNCITPPAEEPVNEEFMDYVKAEFESWANNREKNTADFEAEITKIKLKRERDRVEILWKTYTSPNRPKKSDEDKLRFAEYLISPIIGKIDSIIAAVEVPVEEETLEAPVESGEPTNPIETLRN